MSTYIMLLSEHYYTRISSEEILDTADSKLQYFIMRTFTEYPKFPEATIRQVATLLDQPYTVMVARYGVILASIPITAAILFNYGDISHVFSTDSDYNVTWRTVIPNHSMYISWPTVEELITPTDTTAVSKLIDTFNNAPQKKVSIRPTVAVQYYDVPIPVMLATLPADALSALRKLQQHTHVDAALSKYKSALYLDHAGDIGGTLKSVTFEFDTDVPKVTCIPIDGLKNIAEYLQQMYPQCGIAADINKTTYYARMYEYNGQCLILSD